MAEKALKKALAKTIGKNVRSAREELGWTREEAAERIGISYEFFARIERGHSLPGLRTLRRLGETLRTRVDDLLGTAAQDTPRSAARATQDSEYILGFARQNPSSVRLIVALLKEIESVRATDA